MGLQIVINTSSFKKEMIFEKYPNIKDSAWKYFNEYFVK